MNNMNYSYTARNNKGEVYTSTAVADNRLEIYSRVKAEGGIILSIRERKHAVFTEKFAKMFSSVNLRDKILLAKNLGSMLGAGLSLTRALDVMEKQAKKAALKELLHLLLVDVSKGEPFSLALKKRSKMFPTIFISMVKAGEESGNLPESLKLISIQMEKSYELHKRIRGAMIYPSIIISLMFVISVLLLIYMVPTLTETFSGLGVDLPLSTRIIIGASQFMIENKLLFVLGLAGVITLGGVLIRSQAGKRLIQTVSLKLPVIGLIVREVNSARTARTLSSLFSSGVAIVDALEVTEEVVPNHFYQKALNDARTSVQKGETLSAVFHRYENIYPAFVAEMASVGEETGKVSEMLLNVATFYEEDIDEKTKNLSTIIEPVLMIIIGLGVAVFALSMLAPTYSLVNFI